MTRQQFVTHQDCMFVFNAAIHMITYIGAFQYSHYLQEYMTEIDDFSRYHHSEDAVSVQQIVEEYPSLVLCYKA